MPEPVALACDATTQHRLLYIFAAGCLLGLYVVVKQIRSSKQYGPENAGLLLAYLAVFWMNHFFALGIYSLPWYCPGKSTVVSLGAKESLIGLVGLVAGSVIVRQVFHLRPLCIPPTKQLMPRSLRNAILGLGFLSFIIFHSEMLFSAVRMIFGVGQAMIVTGIVLGVWDAYTRGDRRMMGQWGLAGCAFPFVTIIQSGFLGFGILSLVPIAMFTVMCWPRIRWGKVLLIGLLGGYLALSLFVNYFRDRNEIRRTVWRNDRLSARIDTVVSMFRNFEWFSIYNTRHLDSIDARLNGNYQVGAAVVHIDNTKEWADGKTLVDAALGFIPRFLWPEKPEAGSGNLVSKYTGLQFANGTSVGIGQVMEFYVNYGSPMVFAGFLLFGAVLTWLDTSAMNALRSGDFHRFFALFLIGLSMQNVGGSLLEVVAGVAYSVLQAYAFRMILGDRNRARQGARMASARA